MEDGLTDGRDESRIRKIVYSSLNLSYLYIALGKSHPPPDSDLIHWNWHLIARASHVYPITRATDGTLITQRLKIQLLRLPPHKPPMLPLLYAAAIVAIVAAAATDASSGLPGVGSSARELNQYITTLAGLRLAARQSFLDVSLNRSAYNKRAWTYQESSISRRLLCIASRSICMRCSQSPRSEEIILEDRGCKETTIYDHTVNLELSQRNIWQELTLLHPPSPALRSCTCIFHYLERFQKGEIPHWHFREKAPEDGSFDKTWLCCRHCQDFLRSNDAEWHMHRNLVRGYANRQMKFESDRIPAFASIAGFLQQQFNTRFLFGLPEKFLDFALI